MNESAALAANSEPPCATLDLALLQRRPPRVAVTPGPSLFALAADVAGANRGSPAEWIAAARAELTPSDMAVLRPIGAPAGEFTPGRVVFSGVEQASSVGEELERIATLPVEYLLDDISFAYGSSPPPPWDSVARQPRRWLVSYARALGRVWRALREPWAAATALVDREIERVAIAATRDALPEVMATLHYRAYVREGMWRLADLDRLTLHVADRGLVITPVLGGPAASRATYDEDGLLKVITYALPGTSRVLEGRLLPPAQALESLLGAPRTTILRLLDRPVHAGRLAKALIATPGAVTPHLRTLEGAGLVIRERAGRNVIVHRTARGDALLGLYE